MEISLKARKSGRRPEYFFYVVSSTKIGHIPLFNDGNGDHDDDQDKGNKINGFLCFLCSMNAFPIHTGIHIYILDTPDSTITDSELFQLVNGDENLLEHFFPSPEKA